VAKKFTITDAVEFVTKNSDAVLLETEWKGSTVPLRFRCGCGTEFTTTYNKFQNQGKRKCDACGRRDADAARRNTLEDAVALIRERSLCEYVSGEYRNRKSPIRVRCVCGVEFVTTIDRITHPQGSGMCAKCGIKQRSRLRAHTVESVREAAIKRGAELLSTEYGNAHQLLAFRCSCGSEFRTTFNRFLALGKVRCNACTGCESHGEYAVREWLTDHGIPFVAQKTFPGCGGDIRPYFFDFYLPEHNVCIEFDGEHHFRPVAFGHGPAEFDQIKARDAAKDAYCEENGMRLVRIPYWDLKNVDEIMGSTLIPR